MLKPFLALATLSALLATSTALAHAKLESSTPAANTTVKQSPPDLYLNFTEEGELGIFKLLLGDKDIPVALDWSGVARKSFRIKLPHLAAGKYTVQWSMMSTDDNHVTRGTFDFTVGG